MTFLVNLMFSRLDKCDGPIIEGAYIRGGGGLIFGMLIGLHIWVAYIPGAYICGGSGGISRILRFFRVILFGVSSKCNLCFTSFICW